MKIKARFIDFTHPMKEPIDSHVSAARTKVKLIYPPHTILSLKILFSFFLIDSFDSKIDSCK